MTSAAFQSAPGYLRSSSCTSDSRWPTPQGLSVSPLTGHLLIHCLWCGSTEIVLRSSLTVPACPPHLSLGSSLAQGCVASFFVARSSGRRESAPAWPAWFVGTWVPQSSWVSETLLCLWFAPCFLFGRIGIGSRGQLFRCALAALKWASFGCRRHASKCPIG